MDDNTTEVIPGAEAWSAEGGSVGALVLHGFTGNPSSMRGVAEALVGAGLAVEVPRLPGHGTSIEDLTTTGWADWSGEAEAAYQRLASRTERVVVVGLSMGGLLALWCAIEHPEVRGVVAVNPFIHTPDIVRSAVDELWEAGTTVTDGVANDVAAEGVEESAYDKVPLGPLRSAMDAAAEVAGRLGEVRCPVLLMTSAQDHVVPPETSEVVADGVAGELERLTLERSYHVATIDLDKDLVEQRTVQFAQRVTSG